MDACYSRLPNLIVNYCKPLFVKVVHQPNPQWLHDKITLQRLDTSAEVKENGYWIQSIKNEWSQGYSLFTSRCINGHVILHHYHHTSSTAGLLTVAALGCKLPLECEIFKYWFHYLNSCKNTPAKKRKNCNKMTEEQPPAKAEVTLTLLWTVV